jgi:hypothetical protein
MIAGPPSRVHADLGVAAAGGADYRVDDGAAIFDTAPTPSSSMYVVPTSTRSPSGCQATTVSRRSRYRCATARGLHGDRPDHDHPPALAFQSSSASS